MKTEYKASISYNKGGWKRSPETTLYVTAPLTPAQLQTLGCALGEMLSEHLPTRDSTLENVSGVTSIEYMPIIDLQSVSARYLITSKFKDMDRSCIRYTVHQGHEECDSLQSISDQELVRVTAGLSWYVPRSFALFGSRTPQLSEYWEIFGDSGELTLRISGPYTPSNALPIKPPWDNLLEQLVLRTVEISLLEVVRTELSKSRSHLRP